MRRRALLTAGITAGLAGTTPAFAAARRVLHVRPGDSVQAAVDSVAGPVEAELYTSKAYLGEWRPFGRP